MALLRGRLLLTGLALSVGLATPAAADVVIRIQNRLVTLDARDATAKQILAEWAKVGRTTIVNADKLTGPPLTLQFANLPERQALDIILRSASGYLAAPRAEYAVDASMFDRILVMATSATPPPQSVRPMQPDPAEAQAAQPEAEADEDPLPSARPPVFNFGTPQTAPQDAPTPSGSPMPSLDRPAGAAQPFPGPADQGQVPATPGPAELPAGATAAPANPWGVSSGTTMPGVVIAPPAQTPDRHPTPTPATPRQQP